MDSAETRRRLRAARAYAGMSLDDLAADVEIGRNTLVRMENGQRNPKSMELREIAEACGLPYEFFTIDFGLLVALARVGAEDVLAAQPPDQLRDSIIAAVDAAFDRKMAESTPEEVAALIASAEAEQAAAGAGAGPAMGNDLAEIRRRQEEIADALDALRKAQAEILTMFRRNPPAQVRQRQPKVGRG